MSDIHTNHHHHPHPLQSAPISNHDFHQSPPPPEQYLCPHHHSTLVKLAKGESQNRQHHTSFYGGLTNIVTTNYSGPIDPPTLPAIPTYVLMLPSPCAKKAWFHNNSIILPRCNQATDNNQTPIDGGIQNTFRRLIFSAREAFRTIPIMPPYNPNRMPCSVIHLQHKPKGTNAIRRKNLYNQRMMT